MLKYLQDQALCVSTEA